MFHFNVLKYLLQVFLHDPADIPLVRDLGFAVVPGLHAIIGVTYTQVNHFSCHH